MVVHLSPETETGGAGRHPRAPVKVCMSPAARGADEQTALGVAEAVDEVDEMLEALLEAVLEALVEVLEVLSLWVRA